MPAEEDVATLPTALRDESVAKLPVDVLVNPTVSEEDPADALTVVPVVTADGE